MRFPRVIFSVMFYFFLLFIQPEAGSYLKVAYTY